MYLRGCILFLIFLTSCVKLTREDLRTSMDEPSPLSSTEAAAFLTPYFEVGDWPKEDWWKMFDDTYLEFCIEEGLQNSPKIQQAISNVELASQVAKQKKSSLFPFLSFFAENDYQHISKDNLDRFPPSKVPAVINQIELSLDLEYELDFWQKNRNIYRAALGEMRATCLDYQQAKMLLGISIANAYFDVQFLMEKKRIMEKLLSYFKQYEQLTILRLNFCLDNEIQKGEAEIKRLEMERELLNIEKDLSLNLHLLKFLMGLGPDEELEVRAKSYFLVAFPLPQQIPLDLVARRPDLMAQIWRVNSYTSLIKAAKAAFYPNVNLSASGGLLSLSYDKLFTKSNLFGSLAPALHLPIFTGGLLQANLGAKRAEYDIAVSEYNNIVLQAAKEVSDAIDTLMYVQKQLNVQEKSLINSVMNFDLTFTTYQEGISNYLEVILMKEKVAFDHLMEVTLKHLKNVGALQLIKSLGGGYQYCAEGER